MTDLPCLRTARLDLTPLTVDDADQMVAVYADPQMFTYTGGAVPSLAELRQRYQRLLAGWNHDGSEQWCNWIVRIAGRDDATAIGAMQATIARDRAWAAVAWEVAVGEQGNGYATEAALAVIEWLATMKVARISATIHPLHVASATVARNVGLVATDEMDDGEVVWELVLSSF